VAGPLEVTAASNVAPDGHLRYSFGASTYLYRFRGMMTAQPETFSIAKYLVEGFVKDEHGVAVEGAALHVGKEAAYTDSSGHFLVRFSKHGPFLLSVAPNEFITNGMYETVSAPADIRAESECRERRRTSRPPRAAPASEEIPTRPANQHGTSSGLNRPLRLSPGDSCDAA
jgi:hypothetical protein